MPPEFAPIPNHALYYGISREGTLWSVPSNQVIRGWIGSDGYQRVQLTFPKKQVYLVHRLVLSVFVGPRGAGYDAHHKDSNRSNNRLDNLQWLSHADNVAETYKAGRHVATIGGATRACERHGMRKLTNTEVRQIRELRSERHTLKKIASQFGVSVPTISMLCNGRTWRRLNEASEKTEMRMAA